VKRILFILLAAPTLLNAQIYFFNNLHLDIGFVSVSNQVPADFISGEAGYNRTVWGPPIISPPLPLNSPSLHSGLITFPQPFATNQLSVVIHAGPNPPTDGWLLVEQNESLVPVVELTNLVYIPDAGSYIFTRTGWVFQITNPAHYDFTQTCILSVDQVHQMLDGDWYAGVEFGDDQYLGNLTPDLSTMAWPAIEYGVRQATIFFGSLPPWEETVVIAPDNSKPATVTIDASFSTNAFYLPMTFLWTMDGAISAETPISTNKLAIGDHQFSIEVNDGYNTNTVTANIIVIPPETAVDDLISSIHQLDGQLNPKIANSELQSLEKAKAAMIQHKMAKAVDSLRLFQIEVRYQISTTRSGPRPLVSPGPPYTGWMIFASQQIINAIQ